MNNSSRKLLAEKLNIALGTTIAGDEESLCTHVVFANKSVLRIDLFVYHHDRRFGHTESLSEYHNILAYFGQIGLLDIPKARPQGLIYELTRATRPRAHAMINCVKLVTSLKRWQSGQRDWTERLYYVVHQLVTVFTGAKSAMFC